MCKDTIFARVITTYADFELSTFPLFSFLRNEMHIIIDCVDILPDTCNYFPIYTVDSEGGVLIVVLEYSG